MNQTHRVSALRIAADAIQSSISSPRAAFPGTYLHPFDSATIAILCEQLVFLLLSLVYGVLKIPSLVDSIFSSRSCESALPRAIGEGAWGTRRPNKGARAAFESQMMQLTGATSDHRAAVRAFVAKEKPVFEGR